MGIEIEFKNFQTERDLTNIIIQELNSNPTDTITLKVTNEYYRPKPVSTKVDNLILNLLIRKVLYELKIRGYLINKFKVIVEPIKSNVNIEIISVQGISHD